MFRLNMKSSEFSTGTCSTGNRELNKFTWDFFSSENNISVYLDSDARMGIENKNDGKIKFLWTIESRCFNNGTFDFIKNNMNEILETYEMIFTYNDELLKYSDKFKWIFAMGSWIKNPEIHKKTKLLSMITSNKIGTEQQIYRYNFAINNIGKFDIYGRGFREIVDKEEGLNDYMFSVCIENDTLDTYFTEKILDCFATGTIPVYKGTRNIVNHFNSDGIIFLDDIELSELTPDLYNSKLSAIADNFERVKNYMLPENYMYDEYLKFFNK